MEYVVGGLISIGSKFTVKNVYLATEFFSAVNFTRSYIYSRSDISYKNFIVPSVGVNFEGGMAYGDNKKFVNYLIMEIESLDFESGSTTVNLKDINRFLNFNIGLGFKYVINKYLDVIFDIRFGVPVLSFNNPISKFNGNVNLSLARLVFIRNSFGFPVKF